MVYPIEISEGNYKFPNSPLVARYFYASALLDEGEVEENKLHLGLKLMNRLFTEKTEDGVIYQSYVASLSEDEAKAELKSWLRDFGATEEVVSEISRLEKSDEVKQILEKTKDMVTNSIHIKGIPTLLYDNKKHLGLYEE